jgi:hypothetical protein
MIHKIKIKSKLNQSILMRSTAKETKKNKNLKISDQHDFQDLQLKSTPNQEKFSLKSMMLKLLKLQKK